MLPTGHVAAGFLTAYAVIKIAKPDLDPGQINQLLLVGTFFGFAPDLDEFWFFLKNRNWLVAPVKVIKYHRHFWSHAPVVWLLAGMLVIVIAQNIWWQLVGLILWLAAWSHFVLDSIEYGIMWLWPASGKLYALKGAGRKPFITEEKNFFKHSFLFLKFYTTRVSFYLEVLIIILFLIVFFK